MQATAPATIHTDQLVNGDTGVQIGSCVPQQESTTFRAVVYRSLSVVFHSLTVHSLAGAASTGKTSRGRFAIGDNIGRTAATLAADRARIAGR